MRSTSMLRRRLLTRDARVAVVGQGYVGLSLACAAAEAGFEVAGIDVDADRVDALAAGRLVVPGVDEATFGSGVATGRLRFTADDAGLATSDVICICVPTPVRDHTPDLSYVEQACRDVARHLVAGRLVVLESSTYPGTTNDLVAPLLEASGQRVGRDFLLAYSPERIDPGNTEFHFGNTPRIVGGTTAEATAVAALFYEQMVSKVVPLSSARAAE
ncbi:MAG TPA: NAD(P)-binding domain-containing protein, partial [Actinomycetes bacterium]|nr:NAD(P)-binding domain-containing protein [Actinomycetes bacterium]